LQFSDARSDRATGTVSYDVSVKNLTDRDVLLPLVLELAPTQHYGGVPEGAAGRSATGAWLIDLSDTVNGGVLGKGQSTTGRTITVANPGGWRVAFDPSVSAQAAPAAAPVITSLPGPDAVAGQTYRYQVVATDPQCEKLSYLLVLAPLGMTIDPATGLLSWLPTAAAPSLAGVVVQVYDALGTHTNQAFTLRVDGVDAQPVFDALPGPVAGKEGVALTVTVHATQADGRPLAYWADGLPGGALFDPETRTLNWTPGPRSAGSDDVRFVASDGLRQAVQHATLLIDPGVLPPTLAQPADLTAREGDTVRIRLQASDPDGGALTFSSGFLPGGASLDATTGTFTWVPSVAGTYHVPFTAGNGRTATTQTATITVLHAELPPVFDPQGPFRVQQGQALSFRVFALDPHNPGFVPQDRLADGSLTPLQGTAATVSYTASGLPAGATFDTTTGLFHWQPGYAVAPGAYQVTFTATVKGDGSGPDPSATLTVPVTVVLKNFPPVLAPIPDQSVTRGQSADLTVRVTDADADALTLRAGGPNGYSLPPFVTFTDHHDGTGTFHFAPVAGTPRGPYALTLTASDNGNGDPALARSTQALFFVNVADPNDPPRLAPIGDKVAVIGQPLTFVVRAADLDQDGLTFAMTGLPTGATLAPGPQRYGVAQFSWVPTTADAGAYTATFTVTDDGNGDPHNALSDQQAIHLVVRAADAAPVLAHVGDQAVVAGQTLTVALSATDPDSDPVTYSATNLPAGATLDPVSGSLRWATAPDGKGSFPGVVLTASDGLKSASETIKITVTPAALPPTLQPVGPQGVSEGGLLQFMLVAADLNGGQVKYSAAAPLPPGASLDLLTGRFLWAPDFGQAGDYVLHLQAQGPTGLAATTDVAVRVTGVNRPPALDVSGHTAVIGQPLHFTLHGTDPDAGDHLTYSATGLPPGALLDADSGAFSWTAGPGQAGDYPVTFAVSDGQATASRTVLLRAAFAPTAPAVHIELTPSFPAVPGQKVVVHVLAASLAAITGLSLTVGGQTVMLDAEGKATVTAGAPGQVQVEATATDADGLVGHATKALRVRDPNNQGAPSVAFAGSLDGQRLAVATAVVGTVTGANLDSWVLEEAPLGSGAFVTSAGGTAPVSGAPLAVFDPGTLANGFYRLRLTAVDFDGRTSRVEAVVEVGSAAKPAQYRRAETDLTAHLGGVTINLTRAYDSLSSGQAGAFGFGWRLVNRETFLQTDLPATGREALGVYNPFRDGTRLYLTLPDGRRVGFTFTPQGHDQTGVSWYSPAYLADPRNDYQLASAGAVLGRAGGAFFDLLTGRPYNPADATNAFPAYVLTAPDGTIYSLDGAGNVVEQITPGGEHLYFSDSGITGPGGDAIQFVRDAQGRLARAIAPDGSQATYSYDGAGDLVAARNLSSGSQARYAYGDGGRLTLALGAVGAPGEVIAYAPAPHALPVTADLGAASRFLAQDQAGTLAAGAADRYTFGLRAGEIQSAGGGAVLLGVEVKAAAGSSLNPTLPAIQGLTPLAEQTASGYAFALFAVSRAGLQLLEVRGADGATTGAYTLHQFVGGDANGDGQVDGADAAVLSAALGTHVGQPGYVPAADADRDGVVDAADAQLLAADYGFSPRRPPVAVAGSAATHADLAVSVPLAPLATNPQGGPLTFRITGASNGTARLSGDGQSVIFTPAPGFTGTAGFTVVADDGLAASGPADVTVAVSAAPLVGLRFTHPNPHLDPVGHVQANLTGDFADQPGVPLPASYLSFATSDPRVIKVSADGRVDAAADGAAFLQAASHGIQAVTAVAVGTPSQRTAQLLLAQGLTVAPQDLLLAGAGDSRQLQVLGPGGEDFTAAPNTFYFVSNPAVLRVTGNGLVTALAVGVATVTALNGPAEATLSVRVTPPQPGPAPAGADGAAVAASDGSVVVVPGGALKQATTVSLTPLGPGDVTLLLEPFRFAAAFRLDLGGQVLSRAPQLAVRVTPGLAAGTAVVFWRASTAPDATGALRPVWAQVDTGVVGADGVARSAGGPLVSGALKSGDYLVAYAPAGATGQVRGHLTFDNPLAATTTGFVLSVTLPNTPAGHPLRAALNGAGTLFGSQGQLTIDLDSAGLAGAAGFVGLVPRPFDFIIDLPVGGQTLRLSEISVNSLPVTTSAQVQVAAGAPAQFTTTIENVTLPPGSPSDPPLIESASVELPTASGSAPVLKLVGKRFTFLDQRADAVLFTVPDGTQLNGKRTVEVSGDKFQLATENGKDVVRVAIPQDVAVGLAAVQVRRSRAASVGGGEELSNPFTPSVTSAYVFGALPVDQKVFAIDQGSLALTAKIPVPGRALGVALTPDGTRAYVTLYDTAAVAVIDALDLQMIDADPGLSANGQAGVHVIHLSPNGGPAGAVIPEQIAVSPNGRAAFVADSLAGVVYEIDTDPASPDYNKMVAAIPVGPAFFGLRGLAVNADGTRLFVAAPHRNIDTITAPESGPENILVVDAGPRLTPDQHHLLGAIPVAVQGGPFDYDPFGVTATADPNVVTFTNRRANGFGFGIIHNATSADVLDMTVSYLPLSLGGISDVDPKNGHKDLTVNNGQAIAILPANTLTGPGRANHPDYAFVTGFNFYKAGVPTFDPYINDPTLADPGVPAGSNVGIIRNPFGNPNDVDPGKRPTLVAVTRPIPVGFFDNLKLSPKGDKLYVAARNTGAVFVYDVKAMLDEIDDIVNGPGHQVNLLNTPIDNLHHGVVTPNTAIDLKADYRLDVPFVNGSSSTFKVYDPAHAPIGTGPGTLPQGLAVQATPSPAIQGPREVVVTVQVNRLTGDVCTEGGTFEFHVNVKAKVSLKIGGDFATQIPNPLDGGATTIPVFRDIQFAPGTYDFTLAATRPLDLPGEYDYELTAVDDNGDSARDMGNIISKQEINSALPIGHTIVKGVDIWDGHLTVSSQDVSVPGRGLSLDFTRTYSSAGVSSDGPLGRGWTYSYNVKLVLNNCGELTVIGGEGTGNSFAGGSGHTDPAMAQLFGLPSNLWNVARFFEPQLGYHSTLVMPDLNHPSELDFYTKAHVRYHFVLLPVNPNVAPGEAGPKTYTLRFIEDTNGNRVNLVYSRNDDAYATLPGKLKAAVDDDPSTLKVVVEQSGLAGDGPGRALVFQYGSTGFDRATQQIVKRITQVTGYDPSPGGGDLLGLEIDYQYDDAGNLHTVTRKSSDGLAGDTRVEVYDYTPGDGLGSHNLTAYTDPNGNTTQYVYYGGNDVLDNAGDQSLPIPGLTQAFAVPLYEFVKQVIEPAGRTDQPNERAVTQFTYDIAHGTRVVTDPRSASEAIPPTTYHVNLYGATTEIDEPLGKVTKMEWATPDNPRPDLVPGTTLHPGVDIVMVSKTDALGRKTTFKYDALGNVIAETVALTGLGGGIREVQAKDGTTAGSVTTRYTYDPLFSKMTSKTDAEGHATFYLLDSPVPLAQDTGGPVPNLPAGARLPMLSGFRTGNLLAVIDAAGDETEYAYQVHTATADSGLGDLLSVRDPRGKLTLYLGYDRYGNALSIQDAAGNVTTQTFDVRSRLLLKKDTFGHHVEYAYDGLDRKVRETKFDDTPGSTANQFHLPGDSGGPWAEETLYAYKPGGQVATMTDGLGQETDYVYDGMNRLVVRADVGVAQAEGPPVNLLTRDFYDEDGNLVAERDARGVITRNTYDFLNRRVQSAVTAGPAPDAPVGLGSTHIIMTATYDLVNNKRSETDLHNNQTNYIYDALYRVVETDLAFPGAVVKTGYDLVGNKVLQTDANGKPMTMEYDAVYRLTVQTDAVGNKVVYDYDRSGNVVQETHTSKGAGGKDVMTYQVIIDGGKGTQVLDGLSRPTGRKQLVFLGDPTDPATQTLTYLTTYFYDDPRNRVVITNPRGNDPTDVDEQQHVTGKVEVLRNGLDRTRQETVDVGGLNLVTAYGYDADGNQAAVKDPEGNEVHSTYDGLGRKIVVRYPADLQGTVFQEEFFYDGDNNVVRYVDKRGIVYTTEYDNINRVLTKSVLESITGHGELALMTYGYNDAANMVTELDANQNRTVKQYDPLGRLKVLTDANGNTVVDTYDAVNKRSEIDRNKNVTNYSYDDINRLVLTEEFAPNPAPGSKPLTTIVDTYEDAHNRVTETDRRQIEDVRQNDSLGRLVGHSRKDTSLAASYGTDEVVLERYAYDGVSNKVLFTDAEGNQTKYVYDGANRMTATTEGIGPKGGQATTRYGYDRVGNVISMKNGRPHNAPTITNFPQNPTHLAPAVFDAYYTYDGDNNVLTMTEPSEHDASHPAAWPPQAGTTFVTKYAYDELNKLLAVDETRGGDGGATRFAYDGNRNKVAQQDADGNLTTYKYDALNRLSDTFQHLVAGKISDQTRRGDDLGGSEATALHWQYGYDGNGNQNLVIDALGQETDLTFDYLDREATRTYKNYADPSLDFQMQSITTSYDGNGNVTAVKEVKSVGGAAVTENCVYTYDALDRMESTTNYDGKTVLYSYDKQGNKKSITDPDGVVTSYDYDSRNRVITAHTNAGDTTYQYWQDSLLLAVIYPNGSVADYSFHGNSGASAGDNSYDSAGRLTRLENHNGGLASVGAVLAADVISSYRYEYDLNGDREKQTEVQHDLGGGAAQVTTYDYDNLNRLKKVTYPTGAVTYQYEANGNRHSEVGTDPTDPGKGLDRVYAYDRVNRLLTITNDKDATQSILFTYDANGNRISETVGKLTAGPNGQPTIAPQDVVSMAPYRYGIRNELLETTGTGGQVVRYDYNHAMLRVKKLVGEGTEIRFLYDDQATLIEYGSKALFSVSTQGEADLNNATVPQELRQAFAGHNVALSQHVHVSGSAGPWSVTDQDSKSSFTVREVSTAAGKVLEVFDTGTVRKYDYGDDLLSLTDVGPHGVRTTLFYLRDGLGSTVNLTDHSGAIAVSYRYDAWGNDIGTAGASDNPMRYTGHYFDKETGLDYFGARYYDSPIGEFITQDSYLGDVNTPPSLHRYVYAYDNPLRYVDRIGHAPSKPGDIAQQGKSQRVLIVGAERPEEFAMAERLAAEGNDVTVVNPRVTEAAKAFQANGGRFVAGGIESLPAGEQFDLVHEEFPQPIVGSPKAFALAQERLSRVAPGGTWRAVTENQDLIDTYQGVAEDAGASFDVHQLPEGVGPQSPAYVPVDRRRFEVTATKPPPEPPPQGATEGEAKQVLEQNTGAGESLAPEGSVPATNLQKVEGAVESVANKASAGAGASESAYTGLRLAQAGVETLHFLGQALARANASNLLHL
jgi:RHS repeat-associated protein